MKTVTSVLGDKWVIENGKATPEFGDRSFGVNQHMTEMLENSTKSEKWAKRLKYISTAELTEDKDAILVADSRNNGWLQTISLEDPQFRQDNYFGYSLIYPDDRRLIITEGVGDPGSSYGPYYVTTKDEAGVHGIVGYSEREEDLPEILEKLAGTDLKPLPQMSETKYVQFDLADGFRAETSLLQTTYDDIADMSYVTTIVSPDNQIVANAHFSPDILIKMRDSGEYLNKILGDLADRRDEWVNQRLNDMNDRLNLFERTEVTKIKNLEQLEDKVKGIGKNGSLKLECADNESHIVISWQQVKKWRQMDGTVISVEENPSEEFLNKAGIEKLRLCYEREYLIDAKQQGGFTVSRQKAPSIDVDTLFAITQDRTAFDDILKQDPENPAKYLVIEDIAGAACGTKIDYITDRTFPVAEYVRRIQQELERDIAKYGLELA